MSNETIYSTLRAAGMTQEGACGLMGNMMAESTMRANIAQRGMTSLSDEAYTEAADGGVIDFAHDSVGYGLCQWTFSTRKANLLSFSKMKGVSVGDEAMQVQFCLIELQQPEYMRVWFTLCNSHDIDECADRVCDGYEKPAINNYPARRQYARDFFNAFCGSVALMEEHEAQSDQSVEVNNMIAEPVNNYEAGVRAAVMVMQMVMNYSGYWGQVTGERSPEFFSALRQYTDDLEKM